jgi:hypothetical protein
VHRRQRLRCGKQPDEPLCINLDATADHPAYCDDKDGATPMYKRGGWGIYPLAYPDRSDGWVNLWVRTLPWATRPSATKCGCNSP